MKFFADTANLGEIKYCFERGVDDGITTNPKIMEATGDLSQGFRGACETILRMYPGVPVSLETDLRGIPIQELDSRAAEVSDILLKQANEIMQWGPNVVIKIPISEGGLTATRALRERGVKTNVTACMTPYQALHAAEAGATYVSLFANRMLDGHIFELAGGNLEGIRDGSNWKDLVKSGAAYTERAWALTLTQINYVARVLDRSSASLIVGSIRSPNDILRLITTRPQIITIPTGIVRGLENIPELKNGRNGFEPGELKFGDSLSHPITDYTLAEFEKAADSYRRVG